MYCKIALVITLFHRHSHIPERDKCAFGILRDFHVKNRCTQTLYMLAIATREIYFPIFEEKDKLFVNQIVITIICKEGYCGCPVI